MHDENKFFVSNVVPRRLKYFEKTSCDEGLKQL